MGIFSFEHPVLSRLSILSTTALSTWSEYETFSRRNIPFQQSRFNRQEMSINSIIFPVRNIHWTPLIVPTYFPNNTADELTGCQVWWNTSADNDKRSPRILSSYDAKHRPFICCDLVTLISSLWLERICIADFAYGTGFNTRLDKKFRFDCQWISMGK